MMGTQKDLAQRVREQGQAMDQAAQAAMTPADTIRNLIARNMTRITQALPNAGVTPERLATVAFLTIRKNPTLMECDPHSLVDCILKSAELGLDPGVLGQAWIVPYGREATFVIGYQGMIELARRSGQIVSIQARPVFDGDDFRWSYGLNDELSHHPGDGPQDWDHLTHVYLVAKFKGGGHHFGVMTRAQIEEHRDRYAKGLGRKDRKGNLTSPWDTAPVQMALKTVVRQEWKWLPVSTEVRQAVAEVELAEAEVIEGKGGNVWMGKMEDAMPKLPEPADEPDAEDAPADHQDTPEPKKAPKGKAKAEPKPEPAKQDAWCPECGNHMEVTADATEEDLAGIVCAFCDHPGFSLTCPVADGQQTLTAD